MPNIIKIDISDIILSLLKLNMSLLRLPALVRPEIAQSAPVAFPMLTIILILSL